MEENNVYTTEEQVIESLGNVSNEKLLEIILERLEYSPMYRDWETDRKSTRLNSSHSAKSRMPSSA